MSDQNQYPQDQPPQQPGQPYYGPPQGQPQPQYYGQPPKKKTHKFRNFVVFPFLAIVVVIIIASAAGGGSSNNSATPDASTQVSAKGPARTKSAPQSRNDPRAVTPGKPFTVGKHQLDAGWKVTYEQYIGSKLVGSVTNVSNDTSTAFFEVKFLKGNNVLANFQCSTQELEPNQKQQVECYNQVTTTQRVTGWDKVTAEATF